MCRTFESKLRTRHGPLPLFGPKEGMKSKTYQEVQVAMLTLARSLRSASYWSRDGYYTDDKEAAVNEAKREVLDEIANSIDQAFDIDSTDYRNGKKEWER